MVRNTSALLIWCKSHYILSQRGLNRYRIILNQVTKFSKLLAYCTKMWANLFLWRRTCESFTDLKFWSRRRHEEMTFTIALEGVLALVRAPWSTSKSHSKTTSCSPMSQAKSIASSIAFASTSNGPSPTHSFLLIAATTCLAWSLTTTPTLAAWRELKTTPLMFTLYQGLYGGSQLVFVVTFGTVILWFESQYSSINLTAIWNMSVLGCQVPPIQATFQFFHKLHAIVILSPSSSSPTYWWKERC